MNEQISIERPRRRARPLRGAQPTTYPSRVPGPGAALPVSCRYHLGLDVNPDTRLDPLNSGTPSVLLAMPETALDDIEPGVHQQVRKVPRISTPC
jgi:hypothetical protein